MPPRINNTVQAAGSGYQDPWTGKAEMPAKVDVDITALDDDAVDSGGYLKPGFLFTVDGTPIGTGDTVHGGVVGMQRVAASNSATDIAAALTAHPVIVNTIGQLNRDALEYNLGRALNSDEEAGFVDGGSLKLLQ
jgi:hypothetical protein